MPFIRMGVGMLSCEINRECRKCFTDECDLEWFFFTIKSHMVGNAQPARRILLIPRIPLQLSERQRKAFPKLKAQNTLHLDQ